MIDPYLYLNEVVPTSWLPPALINVKPIWTYGELAQDRTTHWQGIDGKKFVMARQLLHIWHSIPPHKIADMAEDEQPNAILRQQIALGMFQLYPSESVEKKSKSKTAS